MQMICHPFSLKFRHTFHIAAGARLTTDVVYVELHHGGKTGYGEVALPPYLNETQDSVIAFLQNLDIPGEYKTEDFFYWLNKWHNTNFPNYPALAAIDIALHDLQGKLTGKPIYTLYNISPGEIPLTAYTIGISEITDLEEKIQEAGDFNFYKLKLGSEDDASIINAFRKITGKPFCIDANRGWKNMDEAIKLVELLKKHDCSFIEQPFEKQLLQLNNELRNRVDIKIILDESVQTINDIEAVQPYCDGINIKMAKCGGIYPAFQMIEKARKTGMLIFLGCMSEGCCSIAAASHLAPLVDWVDLDGPLLVKNDPFEGVIYQDGRIVLNTVPGSGAAKRA